MLLISGDIDPVTPPTVSEHAIKYLTNSKQVIIANGTHLTETPCISSIIANFFATASAVGLETKCVDEIKRAPFIYKLPRSFKP
jgi:hypothetical protein